MGKIDMFNGLPRVIEDCSALKMQNVESRAQLFPFITIECSKETVPAVGIV
jgi:hypothetical protein